MQSFQSLPEWGFTYNQPTPYETVIHANRRPAAEHVKGYNGLKASELAAIIPEDEQKLIGCRDVVVRRRGSLNSNNNEVLTTINVSSRAYGALTYNLLLPKGQDGWYSEHSLPSGQGGRRTKNASNVLLLAVI